MSEIEQKSKSQNLDALNKVPCPFDEVSLLDYYTMIILNFEFKLTMEISTYSFIIQL